MCLARYWNRGVKHTHPHTHSHTLRRSLRQTVSQTTRARPHTSHVGATMTEARKVRRNLLTASGLALALLVLLYWTDPTGGYFASLDEAETNKNCFCEVSNPKWK